MVMTILLAGRGFERAQLRVVRSCDDAGLVGMARRLRCTTDPEGGRRIALLSRGREFVPSELGSSSPSDGPFDYWLLLVRPGKHDSGYEDAPLVLKTDAFLNVYDEKGASIRYFPDGDWHVYAVSD
jgi:hypothetical protein